MSLVNHFMSKGAYPWTELSENVNLDWFIDNFFSLCNFVKAEHEDNLRMKDWVVKNVKIIDVVKDLVNATAIKEADKDAIRNNLGIKTEITADMLVNVTFTEAQKSKFLENLNLYDIEGVIF